VTGDIVKSFLVGLGFDVDATSLSNFNKSIASATLKVTALYGSIEAAGRGLQFGISKISESFEQLGYEYKIIAPAINKALILRKEMLKAYAATGVNLTKVVQDSVKLNLSVTKTKYAFEALYKSVAARFFPLLTKQSDLFRQKLYANMPKIQQSLENFVKFTFRALEIVTDFGVRLWSVLERVYDFFVKLHDITSGWSTVILAIVAAWDLLNLSFIATPIGAVLAGLLAILALYDDFKVWQEGGKSFFDWKDAIPTINAVRAAVVSLYGALQDLATAFSNVVLGFIQSSKGDFLEGYKSLAKGLGGFAYAASGAPLIDATRAALGANTPLGSNGGGNQSTTNQNLHQQTNINIQGSADAQSVGKAVSWEQFSVNRDLARNMRGALKP
jgi:hypothetical protein